MAKPNKVFKRIVLISLGIVVISLIVLGVGLGLIWNSEQIDKAKFNTLTQNATFYDNENQVINTPTSKKFCPYEDINPNCINAFIAVEDKNFYQHHGLSYPRIIKALVNNLAAGYSKEGASTITQQLIKNTHLTNEKTLERKVREAILALKMEQSYTKEEIIELYLNAIYFGNNIYGIANASEFYFKKTPKDLSLAECAGLAGLIKNPSKFDPIANHDNFVERAHLVLNLMQEQNFITADEYQTAFNDPITLCNVQNHWLGTCYQNMALKEAAQILDLSESDIINYGYQIETYYDPTQQQLLYDAINQPEYALSGEKFAMLSRPNGQVSALWTSTPTLLNARRNFGSAMKPLLVYAPALELGVIQPETLIDDSPLIDSDFNPKNFDQQYHGLVSARSALVHSYNIPAVKILSATTINAAGTIARKLGQQIDDNENLSMALGNTNSGTTFAELATGYQTIANQGKYSPARFVRSIRDRNGNTVYFDLTNKYNYAPQVITQDTAYLLTDMLLDTTRSGTARKLSYLNTDIAAKTGTTERTQAQTNTDATLVSYTPNHVLIVWQGNASMKPEDDLPSGATGGGRLANVAKQIHSVISDPEVRFTRPNSIQEVQLDALDYQQGALRLASSTTPESALKTALFAGRYVPTAISTNYLAATPTTLDGQLGDNLTPQIWFDALPHQTYSIYKNDVLQEVIQNQSGRYTFSDKNPQSSNTYHVTASLDNDNKADSNQITLLLPNTPQSKAVEKKRVPWYF